jgi:transcriptional regulator with XRE-family HTH domain
MPANEVLLSEYIAEDLRNRRKRLGFTETEVSEGMGVAVATVSRYETGDRSPTFERMMDWCISLHIENPCAYLAKLEKKWKRSLS